ESRQAGFIESRDFRGNPRPTKTGQAESDQPVIPDLRHCRDDIAEDELHLASNGGSQARHPATVGHMRDRHVRLLVETREREVSCRAVARGGGVELARLALCERDQLFQIADRELRVGGEYKRVLAGKDDWLEIAQRLVA